MNRAAGQRMMRLRQRTYVYDARGLMVRIAYLAVSIGWWLVTGFGRLSRRDVVTLCYHGVTAEQRRRFARQMRLISGRVLPARLLGEIRRPRWAPPRVCVTFDDGFANLLENALPIARRFRIPATVFVVSENLGARPRWDMPEDRSGAQEPTLSGAQIAELAGMGQWAIGSHSARHHRLTDLPPDSARDELVRSKAQLEALAGTRIDDFAFPYGAYGESLVQAARAAGYARIYTLDSHLIDFGAGMRGAVVGRMKMSPDVWPLEFLLTTAGGYDWLPPVRRLLRRLRGERKKDGETERAVETAESAGPRARRRAA